MLYRVFIPLWAVSLLLAPPTQAVEIYSHVFDGNGDPLNGTLPDSDNYSGGGHAWLAGNIFLDDGSVDPASHGAAILPFVPLDGNVYTLEANILPASTPDNRGWIAIGFLENNNDGNPGTNLSRHSNAGGWAWQIVRNSATWDDQVALNGRNANTLDFTGDFVDATVPVSTKTVLDTTGGAGNWTAEYFLNGNSLGAPLTLPGGASNIQFVGFSHSRGVDGGGILNSFSLESNSTVVAGDFNGDGLVNAADYTVWRNSLGLTGAGQPADGNGDQVVDHNDYLVWKDAYGAPGLVSASVAAIPEPRGLALLGGLSGMVLLGWSGSRWNK